MAKTPVTTWADSFGMWHAEVLLFSDSVTKNAIRARARRAILAEVNSRQGEACKSMPLVVESVVTDPDNPDMIHSVTYREAF